MSAVPMMVLVPLPAIAEGRHVTVRHEGCERTLVVRRANNGRDIATALVNRLQHAVGQGPWSKARRVPGVSTVVTPPENPPDEPELRETLK